MSNRFTSPKLSPDQLARSHLLDGLNAADVLAAKQQSAAAGWLCFGPKAVHRAVYSAVMIWLRPVGYYHYRTLTLLGVWMQQDRQLVIGTRTLAYTAAVYNPESYFKHIQRDFEIYYGRDLAPPSEALLRAAYQPAERLKLRQALQAQIESWQPPDQSE